MTSIWGTFIEEPEMFEEGYLRPAHPGRQYFFYNTNAEPIRTNTIFDFLPIYDDNFVERNVDIDFVSNSIKINKQLIRFKNVRHLIESISGYNEK